MATILNIETSSDTCSVAVSKDGGILCHYEESKGMRHAELLAPFVEKCMDEICREIHISKYYFCRKFKKTTGFTVMDYVLKTRIVAAKGLLSETELSISEISNRCGFGSISYFCRVFKEHTGLTPLQYRKKIDHLS